jgi:hypothetical protein
MKISAKHRRERGGVKRQVRDRTFDAERQFAIESLPLGSGEVCVWQCNPVRPIPYPIHQTQRPVIKSIFSKMIFDEQELAAYTAGLSQKRQWIFHVVEYIHEQATIKESIGKWEMRTVEQPAGNRTIVAGMYLNAFHLKSVYSLAEERGQLPIAAANVEQSGSRRQHRSQLFG